MLSVCQCLTQILNMRIMWGRDVDDIHIRIGKDIFKVIIYLGNLVFFRKCYCFFMCAVGNGIQMTVLLASAVASSFAMTPQQGLPSSMVSWIIPPSFAFILLFTRSF